MKSYLSGEQIYGDSFHVEEIEKWFKEEENGYSDLEYVDSNTNFYPYHLMNDAFGWINAPGFHQKVLGFGSAFGSEFEVVRSVIGELFIIEPAKKFWRDNIFGVDVKYLMPNVSGEIEFDSNNFDLITSFGVLHHIPNVSYVVSELLRVLKSGGYILIREPIISMGDWGLHRPGLTKNERGIPLDIMRQLLSSSGCQIINESLIGFSPLQKMIGFLGFNYWGSKFFLWLDSNLCKLFKYNYIYHRNKFRHKFAPSMGYWVVRKN